MIAEVLKSLTVSKYKVRSLQTSEVLVVYSDKRWTPNTRVIISNGVIIGKGPDVPRVETYTV